MKRLEDLSLKELSKQADEFIPIVWQKVGSNILGQFMNEISYAKIEVFSRQYPECYLGKINTHTMDGYNLVRYDGKKVQFFGYDFIVSVNDPTLTDMIGRYNKPSENSDGILLWKRICEINNRIDELGGIRLLWEF